MKWLKCGVMNRISYHYKKQRGGDNVYWGEDEFFFKVVGCQVTVILSPCKKKRSRPPGASVFFTLRDVYSAITS